MENILLGQNEHNLGLGVQKSSNGHRGLGYKPKAKKDVISYHRVPYSYGTESRCKGQVKDTREVFPRSIFATTNVTKTSKKSKKVTKKVTREEIPKVDLENVTKASKKPNKVTRKVSREVIPSEYLEHPKSTNRFWISKSVFSTP